VEKVVYLLGAGFSAPLGIPVIRDFLIRAKDLYFSDPSKYASFKGVLSQIDQMQKSKSYYNIDLFNIEEILSILQMEDEVTGNDRSSEFADFISEVVKAYTPEMPPPTLNKDPLGYLPPDQGFHVPFFGDQNSILNAYGQFVANLMSLRLDVVPYDFEGNIRAEFRPSLIRDALTRYSIVTLNYDLVIENCIKHIHQHCCRLKSQPFPELELPPLAKLHGSVDTQVVAPTWRKFAVGGLRQQWELAHRVLREANHIRILGYSLPVSDSYIRYLLASAVLESEHLKSIDVICLDDGNGTVEKRYTEFITFKFFRFIRRDITDYLNVFDIPLVYAETKTQESTYGKRLWAEFTGLEKRHEYFTRLH
jgi:hypothetical protein